MTLSFYIARRFALSVLLVFGVFFGLMMLIEMVELVGRFPDSGVSLAQVAGLAALKVPQSLYRILPLIMILAAIALFLALARSSELVVVRASGRSALRLLVAPVCVALALGAVSVMVLNPLVAATSRHYAQLVAGLADGQTSVLSLSSEGLWLRQGGEGSQTVIRATQANDDGTVLTGVTFLEFDRAGRPLTRIEAERAALSTGAWMLTNFKRWDLAAENPESTATRQALGTVVSDLTRDQIRDSFGDPSAVQVWDLPAFIAKLDKAGFSSRKHRVWLQMEFALPVLLAGMVLLAAGFTMRHVRFGNTGAMVLAAVMAGFGIFFLRNFAQVLGFNGQIPVFLAAWSAPVASVLLALGLLLHMEDG
ncbi:MAG: LPS export ABC transporter permease LptG [Rhodobacter sp.]|nr:LPS export ABC transporter permease LptG [Rhodobacter sp.]